MAIKSINSANAGVKRPLRASDLQDIWRGLNEALASGTETTPRIISGINPINDPNDAGNILGLSQGVIAFAGQLFFLPPNSATYGQTLYGYADDSADIRIFSDSSAQAFSFQHIATTQAGLLGAITIGVLSEENVELWRSNTVHKRQVTYEHLNKRLAPTLVDTINGSAGTLPINGTPLLSDLTTYMDEYGFWHSPIHSVPVGFTGAIHCAKEVSEDGTSIREENRGAFELKIALGITAGTSVQFLVPRNKLGTPTRDFTFTPTVSGTYIVTLTAQEVDFFNAYVVSSIQLTAQSGT